SATNLFAIQRDIATAIAGVLKTRLTPQEQQRLAEVPTRNLAAYDDYLHGRNLFRRNLVLKDVEDARLAFENAVQRDPAYADAWAMLSIIRSTLVWEWGLYEQVAAADAAAERAQQLAPDSRLSLLAAGYVRYYGHRDYDGALALLGRAETQAPKDADVLMPIGFVLRRQGEFRAAIGYFERAMQSDPLAVDPVNAAAVSEYLLRNYDQAQRLWERVFSLDPNVSFPYRQLARTLLLRNADRAGAEALVRRAAGRVPLSELVFNDGMMARLVGPRFADELLAAPVETADWPRVMYSKVEGITPVDAHFGRGMLLRELQRDAEARREFETVAKMVDAAALAADLRANSYQGSLHSTLAVTLALLGERERALKLAQEGVAAFGPQGDRFYEGYRRLDLAAVCMLNGDKDHAFDELETLLSTPSPVSIAMLGIDPLWTPLRGDPRFAALLARHADVPAQSKKK
ncbi:MAG TPA: hypothetical protein VLB69_01595, partial [Rudaea sp.]|nr:hypothetical protein [Rudaea sp.]